MLLGLKLKNGQGNGIVVTLDGTVIFGFHAHHAVNTLAGMNGVQQDSLLMKRVLEGVAWVYVGNQNAVSGPNGRRNDARKIKMKVKGQSILYHGIPIVGRMPLFTTDMRQAIRDNLKTQTRRIFKPQPRFDDPIWWVGDKPFVDPESVTSHLFHNIYGTKGCRYGDVGDVRCMCEPLMRGNVTGLAYYRDDYRGPLQSATVAISLITGKPLKWRWKRDYLASIHMPTEAARTVCRITDIRVEKLQEISREDAKVEGFWSRLNGLEQSRGRSFGNAQLAFKDTWDSINAKRGCGWGMNPWVFVMSYKRLDKS